MSEGARVFATDHPDMDNNLIHRRFRYPPCITFLSYRYPGVQGVRYPGVSTWPGEDPDPVRSWKVCVERILVPTRWSSQESLDHICKNARFGLTGAGTSLEYRFYYVGKGLGIHVLVITHVKVGASFIKRFFPVGLRRRLPGQGFVCVCVCVFWRVSCDLTDSWSLPDLFNFVVLSGFGCTSGFRCPRLSLFLLFNRGWPNSFLSISLVGCVAVVLRSAELTANLCHSWLSILDSLDVDLLHSFNLFFGGGFVSPCGGVEWSHLRLGFDHLYVFLALNF